MDRAVGVGLLCWLAAGCAPGTGADDTAPSGTERVVLEVGHQTRWRELRIEGMTDLPDGAVLSYHVTHAITNELPVNEWPARNLISDGTAVVQAGQYRANLNTTSWPQGEVQVRVEFPVAPQPDAVRQQYGEFGEQLTGDNVTTLGSSKVLSARHTFEWTAERRLLPPVSFFRSGLDTLRPYIPGRQPAAGVPAIKLNTNENPYPPSPRAVAALRAFDPDRLRRYPEPLADEFRAAVGAAVDLDPAWVLAGNGSDDLLTMLVRAAAGPGRPVVYPTPTYVLYRTLSEIQEAPVIEVPFDDDFTLPLEQLVRARGAVTFVANPNSPSGTRAPTAQLASLARDLDGLLVIDEAYAAFAEGDALDLVSRHENVAILRTLSKSHGLAGLRLGFAIAQPPVLAGLAKVKDSYNVDAVAARVGAEALADTGYTNRIVRRITAARTRLTSALAALGCRVWPSEANFLLVQPPDGDAARVHRELDARGILVRFFDEPRLSTTVRITIGTDDEQTVLIDALHAILRGPA